MAGCIEGKLGGGCKGRTNTNQRDDGFPPPCLQGSPGSSLQALTWTKPWLSAPGHKVQPGSAGSFIINHPSKEAAKSFARLCFSGKQMKCFDRRSSNSPKSEAKPNLCSPPSRTSSGWILGDALTPCHEHLLSSHFSLLGLSGGQKMNASYTALE